MLHPETFEAETYIFRVTQPLIYMIQKMLLSQLQRITVFDVDGSGRIAMVGQRNFVGRQYAVHIEQKSFYFRQIIRYHNVQD